MFPFHDLYDICGPLSSELSKLNKTQLWQLFSIPAIFFISDREAAVVFISLIRVMYCGNKISVNLPPADKEVNASWQCVQLILSPLS